MDDVVLYDEEIAELELIVMRHQVSAKVIIELAYRAGLSGDLGKKYSKRRQKWKNLNWLR